MKKFLLPLAILVVAFLGLKGCPQQAVVSNNTVSENSTEAMPEAKAEEAAKPAEESKVDATKEAAAKALAKFKEGSTEYKLYSFLSDDEQAIDRKKGNWFDFDKVSFKTGSSEPTKTSQAQLKQVAEIIKQFPDAAFKIGGYTDNVGEEAANVKLSQARADAVLAALKTLGVSEKQLAGAEGYGSQFAIADNATEEGRAQNRRMSIRVKSK